MNMFEIAEHLDKTPPVRADNTSNGAYPVRISGPFGCEVLSVAETHILINDLKTALRYAGVEA